MRKTPTIVLAAAAFLGTSVAAMAQTPAVGDAPAAATVGQDAAIARQREINRERGMTTTGSASRSGVDRGTRNDRMLPERVAPDAEEAAPAGH